MALGAPDSDAWDKDVVGAADQIQSPAQSLWNLAAGYFDKWQDKPLEERDMVRDEINEQLHLFNMAVSLVAEACRRDLNPSKGDVPRQQTDA